MLKFNNKTIIAIASALLSVLLLFAFLRDSSTLISLKNLDALLKSKDIEKVVISDKYVYLKTSKHIYKIPSSQTKNYMFKNYKVEQKESQWLFWFLGVIIIIAIIASYIFRYFQKRAFFDKKEKLQEFRAKSQKDEDEAYITPIKSNLHFKDIGGIDEVKFELEEIISFFKEPNKYKSFGVRMPRGALLVGPPGVGKTMIAKAIANEADVPFYYQSGASFVQIYVGMGAKRVKELFSVAKKSAPSIIFIDEIDAIGKKRDGSSNDEREATLNQLLTEMDGFEDSSGVMVIAATNNIGVLDDALLRAGRFDRRIFVSLPNPKDRESILNKYLNKVSHNLDIQTIAKNTTGFSGATLATLVNEAALCAIRDKSSHIDQIHIDAVKEKVLTGKKQAQILTKDQREIKATYMAAKAFVATYYDISFDKVTLSSEEFTPPLNSNALLKTELISYLHLNLCGFVLCEYLYQNHSSSNYKDIQNVKKLSEKMIFEYAMGGDVFGTQEKLEMFVKQEIENISTLLKANLIVLDEIKKVLVEFESISYSLIKEKIK